MLQGMFEHWDRDSLIAMLQANHGHVENTIEQILSMEADAPPSASSSDSSSTSTPSTSSVSSGPAPTSNPPPSSTPLASTIAMAHDEMLARQLSQEEEELPPMPSHMDADAALARQLSGMGGMRGTTGVDGVGSVGPMAGYSDVGYGDTVFAPMRTMQAMQAMQASNMDTMDMQDPRIVRGAPTGSRGHYARGGSSGGAGIVPSSGPTGGSSSGGSGSKGRGKPVELPDNFLRVPGYPSGFPGSAAGVGSVGGNGNAFTPMSDDELAMMLQNEMFLQQLQSDPEIRHALQAQYQQPASPYALQQQQRRYSPSGSSSYNDPLLGWPFTLGGMTGLGSLWGTAGSSTSSSVSQNRARPSGAYGGSSSASSASAAQYPEAYAAARSQRMPTASSGAQDGSSMSDRWAAAQQSMSEMGEGMKRKLNELAVQFQASTRGDRGGYVENGSRSSSMASSGSPNPNRMPRSGSEEDDEDETTALTTSSRSLNRRARGTGAGAGAYSDSRSKKDS